MIYIIKGSEACFIEDKVKEISLDSSNVIKFLEDDFTIEELLEACQSNSLFAVKTCVLVKDPFFLCKKVDDKKIESLMEYIHHPIYDTDLVLYSLDNTINTKLKVYKEISENADVMEFDSFDYKNFNNYVNSRIKQANLKLSKEALYLLTSICKKDATLFNANLAILSLYPDAIDESVIKKLCTSSDDNISFDLINAIVNKNVSKAISIERKLLKENDSLSIINILASQLRNLYTISYMLEKGNKNSDIMKELNFNEYRFKMALETLNKLTKKEIIAMLYELSNLDYLYKSDNSISDVSRFEFFILSLLKKDNNAIN